MKFKTGVSLVALAIVGSLLVGCNSDNKQDDEQTNASSGVWLKGDIHVHTAVSQDARSPLSDVLDKAFNSFGLDYVSISNHMRNNSQDNDDNDVGGLLYNEALTRYELPAVAALRAEQYANKLIFSSFEWDMPTHEHYGIGIVWDEATQAQGLAAVKEFEYRFSNKNELSDFDAADVSRWETAGVLRQNQTHQDGVAALAWLEQNFPHSSFGMLNHPRRYGSSYTIEDIRDLNNAAPDVFFLIEGMVGNQFNGHRGDYAGSSFDGVYGGVDPAVAQVGGWWDALLGEGRKIWNVANSDHHFKTRDSNASGYYPGEYAKTFTWVEGVTEQDKPISAQKLLDAMHTGNMWGTYGDLIDVLDFTAAGNSDNAITMGQTLTTKAGEQVTITIRFKSPDTNNREAVVNNEIYDAANPGVDHVDLIVGDVGTLAQPGSSEYSNQTNASAHVVRSFSADDWTVDSEGYASMSYTFTAAKHQYFRLRGTNLAYNVTGVTANGEPQRSADVDGTDANYFELLNERNYADLWFYSNPLYVEVQP
ncbi:hypothetical protein L9G74_09185 [Shewanella sp. C32]|uniref:S-layer protein n=1 Tax=Shewanella electrica TaxID=515560 RepID=A0ABT2FKT7_9GAMM|nr:hypothetical protein [Shewanella electrica]MCH1924944.1 hypothetical protein [Shewanella electrica]MCS4556611.1 hypothetical protein [Shewanella electrica]